MEYDRVSRTDLAVEAHRVRSGAARLEGVSVRESERSGFHVTTVEVRSPAASDALCKPLGIYHTVTLEPVLRREDAAFASAATLLSEQLRAMLPDRESLSALVVGLGNRAITPDAVGPRAMESVLATRHLREQDAEAFDAFCPVSVLSPGVLGTTGIEAARMVRTLAADLQPDVVLAVDALACSEPERLCRTIQITDTGITPGSGVGNHREALDRDALGVPVIALGVPTVMDIRTVSDSDALEGLFVTPRNIDTVVSDFSKLTGYAINLALHPGLTLADLDLFLS